MQTQTLECIRLEAGVSVSRQDLAEMSGLTLAEIDDLVDYGALAPLAQRPDGPSFGADCVPPLRRAASLRATFELDVFSVALLVECFQRIGRLEDQVRALEAVGIRR
ncbi:MAG: hypothetical protein JWQ76_4240 [Ramlibacter sp.]|nr:hypothetical protein [Ramlibacter sp.]